MNHDKEYKNLEEWFIALKGAKTKKPGGGNTLGDVLRAQREKLNMNQRQLARASGITPATISRLESGQVKELKSEALKRLADALNVTVDYLVGRTAHLAPDDVVRLDPHLEYIFHVYEQLSFKRREELLNFVRFLYEHEGRNEPQGG
ncbi:MAG: helix-turn-helix domain-containing protein [bacterium]